MFDFSREVFICKCSTAVRDEDPTDPDVARMVFTVGTSADVARLSREYHDQGHLDEIAQRVARGEHWMVGELDGEIVTYTFLIPGPRFEYSYLPGCAFEMRDDTAYGYGAWTPNHLRGRGFRRRAFLEELRILRSWGKRWEASVFIKPQLEGATRSLAQVGIEVIPLWKVTYTRQRTLEAERLRDDDCTRPLFASGQSAAG